MATMTWVLESAVFPNSHPALRQAIRAAGQRCVDWDDAWWTDGVPRSLGSSPTVFHGSLGNADAVNAKLAWRPGAYCPTPAFCCSAWYEAAKAWLLHRSWEFLPAETFVRDAALVAERLGSPERVFVRPDSPLKPFSGRVVDPEKVTLNSLDHGFYYDDEQLPVVVAPFANVGHEWRFVVVDRQVVAGSGYDAKTRSATTQYAGGAAWQFAAIIAASLRPPAEVYVLDLCEVDGDLRMLELNPFGGADLYACDLRPVVEAVGLAAAES